MITVLLDDPIICDLPIKVIKIDEFLSTNYKLNIIHIYTVTLNQSYIVDKQIYNVYIYNNQESNANPLKYY